MTDADRLLAESMGLLRELRTHGRASGWGKLESPAKGPRRSRTGGSSGWTTTSPSRPPTPALAGRPSIRAGDRPEPLRRAHPRPARRDRGMAVRRRAAEGSRLMQDEARSAGRRTSHLRRCPAAVRACGTAMIPRRRRGNADSPHLAGPHTGNAPTRAKYSGNVISSTSKTSQTRRRRSPQPAVSGRNSGTTTAARQAV